MVSVASFSPHSSLAIPTYAPSSLGWSATHQVPSVSFHDSVFDNLGSVCAAEVAISNAATLVRSKLCARRVTSRTPAPSRRANTRTTPKVVSEAQAILFCRRHQPRRPKIRPGKGGPFAGNWLVASICFALQSSAQSQLASDCTMATRKASTR